MQQFRFATWNYWLCTVPEHCKGPLAVLSNPQEIYKGWEVFSEDELSENDLPRMRSQILETINLKRSTVLLSDNNLDEIAQGWSENILNSPDVWFEDPDTGISLSYLISSQISSSKQSASTMLKGGFEPILEQIDTNDTVLDEKWKKLGTGITQNDDGSLNITMVYSD